MKFSIIIPAHNEGNKIQKALESIKSQSFTDYEVIVVCDACEDNTKDIAKQYNATVVEIDAHSSGIARNAGLNIAQGEWILFCDADDWYLHEYVFEMLADKVGKSNEDALFFSLIWKNIGYGPVRSPKGTIYPHVANKCWRRSSINDTRFPTIQNGVAEDAVFLEYMLNKQIKIVEWDMPLYYYNWLNEGSKSLQQGRTPESTKAYWSNH